MKHKLMTMLEFVDWAKTTDIKERLDYIESSGEDLNMHEGVDISLLCHLLHSEFLSQKPELKHFIRVGENGEILTKKWLYESKGEYPQDIRLNMWQKAGEDIIFEGFRIIGSPMDYEYLTTAETPVEAVRSGFTVARRRNGEEWEFNRKFKTIEDVIRATRNETT